MTASPAWNQLALSSLLYPISSDATQAAPGVIAGPNNPGLVTQTGSPSQSVIIKEATYAISGSTPASSGVSLWTPGADVTLPLASPPNASNPRIDLLTVQVTDPGSSSTPVLCDFVWIQGTPASSPSAPSLPASALLLTTVAVPTGGASTITNAMLTDGRTFTGPRGSILYVPSRLKVTSPQAGMHVFDIASASEYIYSGSVWVPILGPGVQATLQVRQAVSGSAPVTQNAANGTDVAVQFPTGDLVYGFTVTSNNRFTPNVKGWYKVSASLVFGSVAGGYRYAWLKKNGAEVNGGGQVADANPSTATECGVEFSDVLVYCNGTSDYLEVWARQNSGSTVTLGGATARTACRLTILPYALGV